MGKVKYSLEFKRAAVDRLAAGEGASELARGLGVRRKFLYLWKKQGRGSAGRPEAGPVSEESALERENARLKKKIESLEQLAGRQSASLDFFAQALRSTKAVRPESGAATGNGSIA